MEYECMDKESLLKTLKEKDAAIKELEKKIKQASYYANKDTVTELPNRRKGLILLEKEIKRSNSNNKSLTICFIDIDDFKSINDNFGHEEGDKVLRYVGKILKSYVRKTDIVMRIGGDEFIIVFCNADINDAGKLWDRIARKIDKLNRKNNYKYNIRLSHGFCEYNSKNPLPIKELIHKADKCMYMDKKNV